MHYFKIYLSVFAALVVAVLTTAQAQTPTPCLVTAKSEFRDSEGKIIADSAVVQVLWSGADQTINSIRLKTGSADNGVPVGDDVVLATTRIGRRQPAGQGNFFQVLTLGAESRPKAGDWLFVRVFNHANLAQANTLIESQLYRCRGELGEFFLAEASGNFQPFELELAVFEARVDSMELVIEWQPGKERRVHGYHLWRSDSLQPAEIRINRNIILAGNNAEQPPRYRVVDAQVQANRTYFYRLEAIGLDGQAEKFGPISARIDVATTLPTQIRLAQNFPNPVQADPGTGAYFTLVRYELPEALDIRITVYNLLGKTVRELLHGRLDGGAHQIHWDGKNQEGQLVPAGIYFYRIESGAFSQSRKMILIR